MSDTVKLNSHSSAPDPLPSTNNAVHGSESLRVAQPSTFLIPCRAMREIPSKFTVVDKDQLSGLVGGHS